MRDQGFYARIELKITVTNRVVTIHPQNVTNQKEHYEDFVIRLCSA